MSQIYFLDNSELIYNVALTNKMSVMNISFSENVPVDSTLTSGFKIINEHNGIIMGDYSDYVTIYRKLDNIVELSNDGSVYIEPDIPEPVTPPPYVPTEEEIAEQLQYAKDDKIIQSKYILSEYLDTNPLVSKCHNSIEGKYNVSSEKQSLMANNYLTYTIAKQFDPSAKLTWNETGKECEEWTEQEYLQLLLEASAYVKPLVSKQQKYEVEINACTTIEEVEAIEIDYSK